MLYDLSSKDSLCKLFHFVFRVPTKEQRHFFHGVEFHVEIASIVLNLEHRNRLVRYQICFKILLTNKTDKVFWFLVLLKKKKKKPKLHFIQILLTVEIITNNEQRTTDKLRKREREWQLSLHSCSSSPALLILHLLVLVALN